MYFYLGDNLYRTVRVEKERDTVYCFDYQKYDDEGKGPDDCIVMMPWIETRKRMQRAWTLREAAGLLWREPGTLRIYIRSGILEHKRGGRVWRLPEDRMYQRAILLNKRMILDFHDYLINTHAYRPRRDGYITPKEVPPRPILEASMAEGGDYYIKTDHGEFIPVWSEPDW